MWALSSQGMQDHFAVKSANWLAVVLSSAESFNVFVTFGNNLEQANNSKF